MARYIPVCVFVFLMLAIVPGLSLAWEAEVIRVIDGDSFKVRRVDTGEEVHIRLFGIDCPEYDQPFGNAAT